MRPEGGLHSMKEFVGVLAQILMKTAVFQMQGGPPERVHGFVPMHAFQQGPCVLSNDIPSFVVSPHLARRPSQKPIRDSKPSKMSPTSWKVRWSRHPSLSFGLSGRVPETPFSVVQSV